MCTEICDGAGVGICDDLPSTCPSLKLTFSKNSLRNTIRVSNSLNPDQAQHFVGLDLEPDCLQR